ncbi:ABC transporter sugar ATP-binding protein [Oceanicola granulosus HTCC2516]|uniref:ABC transporter sugar ATP-binding protein n=1 Tax=Oceanicola granulosus (strain ATCC BAA-861 / DSM 15982 / KCTC 12143 / HTCC2516) TaxID=314256 RepID=Q2CGN4_OCEGH|nr:sn-glycerol-3-phosphate ABC transporter ATP-binding protein UgpC [Oceanicola granulosus]EAR51901.1 ABC transporter sugar ATP-binding protein [Oceanicola granulosus HTCC2516]
MTHLELRNITKAFGGFEVIRGVDLAVNKGEFLVFVGPSGCGKSTMLRMIAGLETITGGQLVIDGAVMNDEAPVKRGVAMVFQSYALYPNMSVRQNLAFGLEQARMPKPEIRERVEAAAETLKITPLLDRRPGALSGGQSQRVAIGRAIVRDPDLFLFDEPLSNLDAELRVHMRVELKALHARLGRTMIYVTHDQTEAMTMADRIVVFRDGQIEQIGSPLELYNSPVNRFVAGFIGSPQMNFLPLHRNARGRLQVDGGAELDLDPPASGDAILGLRPELAELCEPGAGFLDGRILTVEHLGGESFIHLQPADHGAEPLVIKVIGQTTARAGDLAGVTAPMHQVYLFDAATDRCLMSPTQPSPLTATPRRLASAP